MKIRMLTSRVDFAGMATAQGEIIDLPKREAARYIALGQAAPVAAHETAALDVRESTMATAGHKREV